MDIGALIRELGSRLELPTLEPDLDGRVQITFGTSVVDIEPLPDQDGFVLAGRLGATVALDDPVLLCRLLEINLFGRLSSDTFFAIERASSQLVVCSRHAGEADYRTFEAHIENFLDALDGVKDMLRATTRQSRLDVPSEGMLIRI